MKRQSVSFRYVRFKNSIGSVSSRLARSATAAYSLNERAALCGARRYGRAGSLCAPHKHTSVCSHCVWGCGLTGAERRAHCTPRLEGPPEPQGRGLMRVFLPAGPAIQAWAARNLREVAIDVATSAFVDLTPLQIGSRFRAEYLAFSNL